MMDQTDRSTRTRTFLKAVIDYNHGAVQLECVVKNISATGARLDVTAAVSLPSTFNLRIPHRGETSRCGLVWREQNAVGVRFLDQRGTSPAPQPNRGTADLEEENLRLKRKVRQLTARLEALGQDAFTDERP